MKKNVLFLISMLLLGGISVKAQDLRTNAEKDADEFIDYYGLEEDYSTFYIRTSFSYDHGLCYYDPCDYYDEDQGVNYDYLTTIRFDPATGLDYDLYGGYHINRFLSVEAGASYFYGLNINQTRTGGGEGSTYSETLKMSATMLSIDAGFEASLGFKKFDPFVSVLARIGVLPRIYEKETTLNNYKTTTTETVQTSVYHGGIPIGFDIKAGVDYKLSKLVDIYADLNFCGLNYTPTKNSMKTYTVNGKDEFQTLTTKQKEIVYVKNYDKNVAIPSDSPNKQLKVSFPFTGLGIDIGVKFNLGPRKKF